MTRFALVVSTYNEFVTDKLQAGATAALSAAGVAADAVTVLRVPEAFVHLCERLVLHRNPARFARRSHSALSTAEMAMCMTPFSGPSQRNWLSPISIADVAPRSASSGSTS